MVGKVVLCGRWLGEVDPEVGQSSGGMGMGVDTTEDRKTHIPLQHWRG